MKATEKLIGILSVVLILIIFGLIAYAWKGKQIDLPGCVTDVQPYEEGGITHLGGNRYQIRYVARMWTFMPARIELPVGSEVDIYLVSKDVVHGFIIPGTNVNLMAIPGSIAYARVKFDKPGTYHIYCHEFCGLGHQNMFATIEVK